MSLKRYFKILHKDKNGSIPVWWNWCEFISIWYGFI